MESFTSAAAARRRGICEFKTECIPFDFVPKKKIGLNEGKPREIMGLQSTFWESLVLNSKILCKFALVYPIIKQYV